MICCSLVDWGLDLVSDYLQGESVESEVCPSFDKLWETSVSLSSKLCMGIECCVVSLVLVVLILRVLSGEGWLFIC